MVRVGGILDDAWRCRPQAAYMVNVLSGGQLGAGDPLGSLCVLLDNCTSIPLKKLIKANDRMFPHM